METRLRKLRLEKRGISRLLQPAVYYSARMAGDDLERITKGYYRLDGYTRHYAITAESGNAVLVQHGSMGVREMVILALDLFLGCAHAEALEMDQAQGDHMKTTKEADRKVLDEHRDEMAALQKKDDGGLAYREALNWFDALEARIAANDWELGVSVHATEDLAKNGLQTITLLERSAQMEALIGEAFERGWEEFRADASAFAEFVFDVDCAFHELLKTGKVDTVSRTIEIDDAADHAKMLCIREALIGEAWEAEEVALAAIPSGVYRVLVDSIDHRIINVWGPGNEVISLPCLSEAQTICNRLNEAWKFGFKAAAEDFVKRYEPTTPPAVPAAPAAPWKSTGNALDAIREMARLMRAGGADKLAISTLIIAFAYCNKSTNLGEMSDVIDEVFKA